MTAAAAAFAAVIIALDLIGSKPPFEMSGYLIGRDFVNPWMGARAALSGHVAAWFDFEAYNAELQRVFGPGFPQHSWLYPPHFALLVSPLGFLPYLPALAIWTLAGFALYLIAAAEGERRPDRLLMLAVSPAVVVNILDGQTGFFTAVLLIVGLRSLDRRPIVSGVAFGLLTVKPQLGLLLPLMLVMTAQWRTIAAAAATTLALLGITSAIFGAGVWIDYLDVAIPMQQRVLAHGGGSMPLMMPTPFENARLAGLPLEWAWAVQTVVSIAAMAAVSWTYARRRDPTLSVALFVTASFLATPYAFIYDMVVFGWVLARLRGHEGTRTWDDRLAMTVWTLPVTTVLLGLVRIPVSSLPLAVLASRLIWRMARADRRTSGGSGSTVEAAPGFEPGMRVLQTLALPLGYAAGAEDGSVSAR